MNDPQTGSLFFFTHEENFEPRASLLLDPSADVVTAHHGRATADAKRAGGVGLTARCARDGTSIDSIQFAFIRAVVDVERAQNLITSHSGARRFAHSKPKITTMSKKKKHKSTKDIVWSQDLNFCYLHSTKRHSTKQAPLNDRNSIN
jgi:hypothetical protein